jgi:hypothetical protein
VIKADPEIMIVHAWVLAKKWARPASAVLLGPSLFGRHCRGSDPLGFLIIMINGTIITIKRGDRSLTFFLILSAGVSFCGSDRTAGRP